METAAMLRSLLGSPHHSPSAGSEGGSGSGVAAAQVVELPAAAGARLSLLDSCHRKIRLLGGGPVAFLGGLVAKARRKDKEPSTPSADDPKLYLEEALLERKLPDIDLRVLVDLPAGVDYNEWLASHTIAFFDHINLLYGTISEFCTMSGCPDMTGPGYRTYLWFDDKGKKARVAAPQYIDYVMTFTQKTISDETIFPTKYGNEFPSSFESIVRKILRLLFHVLAHLYHCHFKEVVLLNLHAHLNCVFAHLTLLNERFQLIEVKETEILQDLVLALKVHSDAPETSTNGEDGIRGNSDSKQSSGDATSQSPSAGETTPMTANNIGTENEQDTESGTGIPSSSKSDLLTSVSEKEAKKEESSKNHDAVQDVSH
ncbi:MOB kinase activator-like 2 isoform X1 [Schistocerca gregaria]|uniref:MOB kinase activator-like 2 isoform X1 n=1 Tax=Schistocerca gregaria TaxID=7010 RepID=UPI00211DE34D|nr:MOB kinase activator-like 2 isoform X1 [Schistocerca gregaria]